MAEQSLCHGGNQQEDAGENPTRAARVSSEIGRTRRPASGTGRDYRQGEKRHHRPRAGCKCIEYTGVNYT